MTVLLCNLQKETRGSGFSQRKVPAQEDVYEDYGGMADMPVDAVKQYGDLTVLK